MFFSKQSLKGITKKKTREAKNVNDRQEEENVGLEKGFYIF